jgi:hypothetical protein
MFAGESRSAPASCRHGARWMLPRFCVGPHIPSPESHALKVPFGPNHSPPPSFRIRRRRRRHSSQHALPCSMDRASCRSTCRSEGRGKAPTTTLGCAQRPAFSDAGPPRQPRQQFWYVRLLYGVAHPAPATNPLLRVDDSLLPPLPPSSLPASVAAGHDAEISAGRQQGSPQISHDGNSRPLHADISAGRWGSTVLQGCCGGVRGRAR